MLDEGDLEARMRQMDFTKEHPECVSKANRTAEYIEHLSAGGFDHSLSALKSHGIEDTSRLDDSEFLSHRTFDSAFRAYCRNGNLDGVLKSVASGVDVDSYDVDGDTPLMIAAAWNRADIVKLLLEVGADPTARNTDGYTAPMLARKYDATAAYALLQEYDYQDTGTSVASASETGSLRWATLTLLSLFRQHITPVEGPGPLQDLINDLFTYSIFFMRDCKVGPYAYEEADAEFINNLLGQVHSLQELRQLVAFETLHNDWSMQRSTPPLSAMGIVELKSPDYFEYYEARLQCWKSYVQVFVQLGCLIGREYDILPERCLDSMRSIVNYLNTHDEQREALFVRNAVQQAFAEAGYDVSLEAIETPADVSSDSDEMPAYTLLARQVYEENRDWAIELCETAIEEGDVDDGPLFLAWLLEKENPERSKELYQLCVDNGNCYAAANNLAFLVEKDNPDKAAELYQLSIDSGNEMLAARNLANLVKDSDPEKAKTLYRMAIDAGDEYVSTFQLALLLEKDNAEEACSLYRRSIAAGDTYASTIMLADLLRQEEPDEAAVLYRQAIDAGNVSAYAKLARLLGNSDPDQAIALCEAAVDAGDTLDAPFYLAWLLEARDQERSKKLYQFCIDSGNVFNSANNLANLIKGDSPDRAKELFELSLDAGNAFYAAMNLAGMVSDEDPERAAELYQEAIDAGNVAAYAKLARLISKSDRRRAIELCEKAVEAGDRNDAPFFLAYLLQADDPNRSTELYQFCIENGNHADAAFNLALLTKASNPQKAVELYLQAAEAGVINGYNDAAVLLMKTEPDRALSLFRLAIDKGDEEFAPCNLAHMFAISNPEEAVKLYKLSLENEHSEHATESLVGLGLLLESTNPIAAAEYRDKAMLRSNLRESIDFMADYYEPMSQVYAKRVRDFLT